MEMNTQGSSRKLLLKVRQKERYRKPSGSTAHIRIKESTLRELQKAQERFAAHLGATPSLPLIIRRSLSSYLRAVSKMDDKRIQDEAFTLKEFFRA